MHAAFITCDYLIISTKLSVATMSGSHWTIVVTIQSSEESPGGGPLVSRGLHKAQQIFEEYCWMKDFYLFK